MALLKTVEERFWSKVDIRGENECWPWTAAIGPSGYGTFGLAKGDNRQAPRFAYELANHCCVLPFPKAVVKHSCDNRQCCNPDHLSAGSQHENLMEMVARGRAPSVVSESYRESRKHLVGPNNPARGEHNGFAHLTEHQVQQVRNLGLAGMRQVDIAATVGLSQSHVSRILCGKARTKP